MYTAKLINRVKENGVVRWIVEFSNGTDTFTDSFKVNKYVDLRKQVTNRLNDLNFVDTFTLDAPIDLLVDTPVVQTPEQIAEDKWVRQYYKWLKIKTTLIDTGILTGNETKIANLKAKVQSDYLPAYIDNL